MQQQKQFGGKRIAADSAGREKAYEKKRPKNLEEPSEKEHVNNSEKYFTIPSRMKEAQNGLYVNVGIRGINTSLLVDTGATDTFLSSTVYHIIPSEKVPIALFAYRSAVQESTGETPNMLMLGREVQLPIDLTVESTSDIEEDEPETQTDYALALRERMRSAHEQARQKLAQAARHQKRTYDRKTERDCLQVGNFVWYFNPAKTKGLSPKLQRKWKGPYLITHKLADVIYRIQRKPRGKMMVIHCDRLKPYVGETLKSWISEPQSDSTAVNAEDITGALNSAPEEISVEDDTYTSDEHLVISKPIPSPRSSAPTTENPTRVVDTPAPPPRRLKPTPAPRTNPSRQRVAQKRLIQEM